MNYFIYLYLYTFLYTFAKILGPILIVTGVLTILAAVPIFSEKNTPEKVKSTYFKVVKCWFVVAVLAVFLIPAVPSKKDLKFIIGGGVLLNGIEGVSKIEGIEKLPKNLVGAANKFLEDVGVEEE